MHSAVRLIGTLSASLLLAGCTLEEAMAPPELRIQADGGVPPGNLQKVTTNGQFITFFNGAVVAKMKFHATRRGTGPVSGDFEYIGVGLVNDEVVPIQVKGPVQCFTIFGNVATLVGLITQSNQPSFNGLQVFWEVTDNSLVGINTIADGDTDLPDTTSDLRYLIDSGLPPEIACQFFTGLQGPIQSGDIMVAGGDAIPF